MNFGLEYTPRSRRGQAAGERGLSAIRYPLERERRAVSPGAMDLRGGHEAIPPPPAPGPAGEDLSEVAATHLPLQAGASPRIAPTAAEHQKQNQDYEQGRHVHDSSFFSRVRWEYR
jgi:hypothetical protein